MADAHETSGEVADLIRAHDILPADASTSVPALIVPPLGAAALPRLLNLRELLSLSPKEWLVEGLLQQGDLAVLYGPSGEGKTFVAIDIALCVATGAWWHGHAVRSGPVVYIAAEGAQGLRNRVRAWAGTRLDDPTDPLWRTFHCIAEAVQLRTDLNALVAALSALDPKPCMIVVDTLARCIVGIEENSATEMGEALHACVQLQQATGSAVLLVHHTGKGEAKDVERGSSALRAAAETMILVKRDEARVIHVTVTKQKEADGGEHVALKLEHVDLGKREGGTTESSCRLVPSQPETGTPESHPDLSPNGLKVCLALADSFMAAGATSAQLRDTCGVPKSSYYRTLKDLVGSGYVRPESGKANARHTLTEKFVRPGVS